MEVNLERIRQQKKIIERRFTRWSKTGTSNEIPTFPRIMSTTQALSKIWRAN